MKKLMIAAAVVCAAVAVQAASFTWQTKASQYVLVGNGKSTSSDRLGSGTAYIFDAAKVTQQALVEAFATDKTFDISTFKVEGNGALDHQSVSKGVIAVGEATTYGTAEAHYNLYFAIVNGDNLYVSTLAEYVAPAGADAEPLKFSETNASKPKPMDAKTGYSTAGWYTAVPEPTSGLLLLLGVAGLALRRRRA